ncbi:hypothetical protein ACFU99_38350 [Streptomyces sp. NPDC057654]|uniref:hypothetical protein n=1 Tax=Streptomyces sp. NPDC057654 TaxID=3346196 RepID=UPI0036BFF45B
MEQLPESVDRKILDRRNVQAIMEIVETTGCPLHQAIDVFSQRYEELRRDRPDDFKADPGEHSRGT